MLKCVVAPGVASLLVHWLCDSGLIISAETKLHSDYETRCRPVIRSCVASTRWFDELNLDPDAHPVAMATRALGDRPWLVADERRDADLAEKRRLIRCERNNVLHTTEQSTAAAAELANLIGIDTANKAHPLATTALEVQEDLCLLQRRADGWHLDASCVCFPTRWKLADKVGRRIGDVHSPVDDYDTRIDSKVNRLFDRLTNQPVWRRNWFLMSDPALYQPHQPVVEKVITAANIDKDLFIRSERQTLRTIADGWAVFTIRIQQEPVGVLLDTEERRSSFTAWVAGVSSELGQRRHMGPLQRRELLAALS